MKNTLLFVTTVLLLNTSGPATNNLTIKRLRSNNYIHFRYKSINDDSSAVPYALIYMRLTQQVLCLPVNLPPIATKQ
jgi:hypothetical protein